MAFNKINKICVLLLSFFVAPVFAAEAFLVRNIEVDGLQRVNRDTVLEYLPVHVGQVLSPNETSAIITALYQTGFFSDVSLVRQGNTLVVQVVERPTIGLIKLSGNKEVKTEHLMDAMRKAGLAEGQTFDQVTVSGMKQALLDQYYMLGRYDATVDISVTKESRNRVALDIHIYEGKVARVKEIHIIGNKVFDEKTLLKNLELLPRPWWAFLSKSDQYSAEKLQATLDSLRAYYFDRGYLKFKIDSSQVTMTPNRKDVYITIRVTEGEPYTVSGFNFSGNLLGQEATIRKFVPLRKGEIFSRQKLMAIDRAIGKFYGNQGYAHTVVHANPTLDDVKKTVFITFDVNPGSRVYVRHINYFGNTKTADYVLRRETRQLEGGVYSVSNLEESKRRLNNLGYVENIEVQTEPVPGKPDQVDIAYTLKEASSTTASGQVGYSDTYGLLYGASIVQKNFRGSGRTVSLGFNNSQYLQTYSFSYFNPYYTTTGISRGFNLYFQKTTPGDVNLATYTLDSIGGMMNYRIPMSEYNSIGLGYGYEYLLLKIGTNPSDQIQDFVDQHGNHFNNVKVTFGWTYNSLDKAIFPTKGFYQFLGGELGLPLLPDSLDYVKLNYDAALYRPIYKGFILVLNTELGYGNGYGNLGELPFFKNFYAGGMGTVRGYAGNTLGPVDSHDHHLGGSVLTAASINLIVPNPISERVRTSVFVDAGNVYNNTFNLGEVRYSAGLQVDWLSPLGPLKFSLAKAFNPGDHDELKVFDFSAGTSF